LIKRIGRTRTDRTADRRAARNAPTSNRHTNRSYNSTRCTATEGFLLGIVQIGTGGHCTNQRKTKGHTTKKGGYFHDKDSRTDKNSAFFMNRNYEFFMSKG
jgi:hypothetical protein